MSDEFPKAIEGFKREMIPPCRICGKNENVAVYREEDPSQTVCTECCDKAEHADGETGHMFPYERGSGFECKYCGIPVERLFMYTNCEVKGISPIYPQGTNSTMFTECCDVAICNDEKRCPRCKALVVGHDESTDHNRGRRRWESATRNWVRRCF